MKCFPAHTTKQKVPEKRHARFSSSILGLSLQSILVLFLFFLCNPASAHAATLPAGTRATARSQTNPLSLQVSQLVRSGRLARTVNVLNALPPTLIEQFPLVPSGLKQAFPDASGLVTIVRGDRDNAVSDTITVDVQHMPANITFTIFLIELANKPFGNVEYVADLTTRGDGTGETVFQCIALVAFAMDARNPGISSDDREGATSGTNLEHLGMWFSSLQDAQRVLNNDGLQGTIFDGGSPPLHAGPQALTDGQSAPVF